MNDITQPNPRSCIKTLLLGALAGALITTTQAQIAAPTPQSVAPNYTPPAQQQYSGMGANSQYHYVAPHAGTWDFYLSVGYWVINATTMNAPHVRIDDHGVNYLDGKLKMNFDNSWSFGFGAGYNITEQLSVHGQFAYANPDYYASFIPDDPKQPVYRAWGSADISVGDLALRYDILPGKIRPFIQGSVGFMYIDTGIPNGPYQGWWDYYWGDYYDTTPTVHHTYLTLGATGGLSYYFSDHVYAQFTYTANWANTPHSWMLNQRYAISVGWNY